MLFAIIRTPKSLLLYACFLYSNRSLIIFKAEVLPHQGFVDGDAVERFLDFTRAQKAEVLKKLQAAGMTFQNVEEITEEVESIYRLH